MVYYLEFFNLRNNFSWNDLEDAYQSKLNSLNGLNLPDIDKSVYSEQVQLLYRDAKRDLTQRERNSRLGNYDGLMRNYLWNGFDYFDRLERRMNQHFSNLYERLGSRNLNEPIGNYNSSSYREISQSDGSTIVVEETSSLDNHGHLNRTRNSYRRLVSGVREPLDYNEALRLTGVNNSIE